MRGLALLAGLMVIAGPVSAEQTTFKDWWVACDNLRVCTAYGFPPDEGGGMVLRVRREADANAAPELDLSVDAERGKSLDGPLSLSIGSKVVARTSAPDGDQGDFRTWALPPTSAGPLLAAIASGDTLTLTAGSRDAGVLSLAGASAALRWMDDRQKRAGGVTAIIAKGRAPVSAVPPPPPLPTIYRAPPVGQSGLPARPPAAVTARLKSFDCAADAPDVPEVARLSPGVLMWTIPCWVGAYQTASALLLTDEHGGDVRLADLGGEGDPQERALATSAVYDVERRELNAYAKGRGVGDCGYGATWAWTGQRFALTHRSELSVCRELSGDFFVETFRSR